MTWPAVRVRTLLGWIVCALLVGMGVPAACADGPTLTASFGIAGRYRPGGWCPVMVTVRNPNGDSIAGQIQILSADSSPQAPGRFRASASAPAALFARPITLPGGMATVQTVPVYVRGIDPGSSDITVQLVEGRERGDGRVLARISTQDQNTSGAITGTPVSGNDLLMVGFGGDPGAFTSLNGLTVGGRHASGPLFPGGPNAAPPQGIQVAEAVTAADLPDRAAGYGGVLAVLLRSDAPVEALTEAQADALRGWVASGGHLIVIVGVDTTRLGSSFYQGLLPKTANGSYGAGRVTVTAAAPTDWRPLLTESDSSSLLTHTAAREENNTPIYYGGGALLLTQTVVRGPSLDAPGTEVIGLFLLVYLIVLVPANYLILKRLDRKELAWVTIPVLVLVFAFGTFAVGYAAKGGAVFVNRAAILETTAGRREAGVYSEIGLFSPRRTSYDLTVPGTDVLAALPNPGINYGYSNSRSESQSYGQTQFVQTPEGISLPNMAYNMWSMRAFDSQSTTDLGGTITARVAGSAATITNHTPHKLTDCAVLANGQWKSLGDLAAGASRPVSLPEPRVISAQVGQSLPPLPVSGQNGQNGQNDPNDTQADIHARMQAALAEYVRSLGQQSNNYSGGQSPQPYTPAPTEVLLVGWSNDPALAGPSPRVDGQAVTENDVSLVVIHLPMSGPMSRSISSPMTPPIAGIGL